MMMTTTTMKLSAFYLIIVNCRYVLPLVPYPGSLVVPVPT